MTCPLTVFSDNSAVLFFKRNPLALRSLSAKIRRVRAVLPDLLGKSCIYGVIRVLFLVLLQCQAAGI